MQSPKGSGKQNRGRGGAGLQDRYPPFLVQKECDSSPFDHQSIFLKDRFMGTAKLFDMTEAITFNI